MSFRRRLDDAKEARAKADAMYVDYRVVDKAASRARSELRRSVLRETARLYEEGLADTSVVALAVVVAAFFGRCTLTRIADGCVAVTQGTGLYLALATPDGVRGSPRKHLIEVERALLYTDWACKSLRSKCRLSTGAGLTLTGTDSMRLLCECLDRRSTLDILSEFFPVAEVPEMILAYGTTVAALDLPPPPPVSGSRKRKRK
jgi:hypothetical protein